MQALVKETVDISPWSLSAHLLKELETDDFTDVEFVMDDGRRVPAHKIVLGTLLCLFVSAPPPLRSFIRPSAIGGGAVFHGCASDLASCSIQMRGQHFASLFAAEDEDEAAAHATLSTPPPPAAAGAAVGSLSRFETELRAAFFDERLTDVDLISSEEDRIPCHQVIICSQSEVFRTMMTIGMLESHRSEIFIQNASTDTLLKVNNKPPFYLVLLLLFDSRRGWVGE